MQGSNSNKRFIDGKWQYKKFSHSPFFFIWDGVHIDVDENGKISFLKEDGEFSDKITTTAAAIFRLTSMLTASQIKIGEHSPVNFEWNGLKVNVSNDATVILSQWNEDEEGRVEDVITTKAETIFRLASMLSATKKVTWQDKPYVENQNKNTEEIA